MRIEVLYPELGMLYGDPGNLAYLKACLPDAEIINTDNKSIPAFVKSEADLVYVASMTENNQLIAIRALSNYINELKREIQKGTFFLFTGNTIELLGQYIETETGEKIDCLGLYDFHTCRDMTKRINYLFLGDYEGLKIVGNKSQFSTLQGNITPPFITVEKGLGNNEDDHYEGLHDHNLFATYLLGPFLVLNPLFTEQLIKAIDSNNELAFRQEIMEAYNHRLEEMNRPELHYRLSEH